MRHARILGLATIAAFAGTLFAQEGAFRFFLDTKGVGEQTPRPANDPLAFTNPDVTGAGRVYLYFEFHDDNTNLSGISFGLGISGPAHFIGGRFYNNLTIGGVIPRWQAVTGAIAPTPGSNSWPVLSAFKVGGGGYGLRNNDGDGNGGPDVPGGWVGTQQADSHFRRDDGSPYGTTLLGFADVVHDGAPGGPAAELRYFAPGTDCGIIPECNRWVYFGYGDPAVPYYGGNTSLLPDALILALPEPSSLVVASVPIAVWALLRARHRGRR